VYIELLGASLKKHPTLDKTEKIKTKNYKKSVDNENPYK
jgi:hypothetical protein